MTEPAVPDAVPSGAASGVGTQLERVGQILEISALERLNQRRPTRDWLGSIECVESQQDDVCMSPGLTGAELLPKAIEVLGSNPCLPATQFCLMNQWFTDTP